MRRIVVFRVKLLHVREFKLQASPSKKVGRKGLSRITPLVTVVVVESIFLLPNT